MILVIVMIIGDYNDTDDEDGDTDGDGDDDDDLMQRNCHQWSRLHWILVRRVITRL